MRTMRWIIGLCIVVLWTSGAWAQGDPAPPTDPAARQQRAEQIREQRREDMEQRQERLRALRQRRGTGQEAAPEGGSPAARDRGAARQIREMDPDTRRALAERRRARPVSPEFAMKRQLRRMENEHNRRIARLQRIRMLAERQKDTTAMERADALLKREEAAFSGQKNRLEQRQNLRSTARARRAATERAVGAAPGPMVDRVARDPRVQPAPDPTTPPAAAPPREAVPSP